MLGRVLLGLMVKGLHGIWGRVLEGTIVCVCGGGRLSPLPSHPIILARSALVPFEISREGSKAGVSEDVMMLAQDVSCVSLELLPSNCPVGHRKP
jgi:hypothetical protein